MYVILVYDIVLDEGGAKVLRNVFKTCKKYLVHIQNSTFEGEISESQMLKLKNELKKHLRKELDSCITFKTRNEKWLEKEFLAKKDDNVTNFL